jgi:UDP-N-acetylmuramyl pentapeptide phosphotransferase/UDP-N-acetylglucosamine-1-phosphate transferase
VAEPLRIIVTAAAAFVVAVVLTPVLRNAARRRGYLDVPNDASSHTVPTPRNGGFAVLAGIVLGFMTIAFEPQAWKTLLVVLCCAALPIVDEFHPLSRVLRFVIQFALALAAVLFLELGPRVVALSSTMHVNIGVLGSALAVIWIVAVLNTYNFMDGLNGLASSAAVWAGLTAAFLGFHTHDAIVGVLGVSVAAAAAGFIPWNVPSGSVFMGDVGSATLGLVLALVSLRLVCDGVPAPAALLPLLSFCSDAFVTIIRRALKGERFFATRHRSHFYQLLNQQGWSHTAVAALWSGLMIFTGAAAIGFAFYLKPLAGVLALGAVIVAHVAVFAWVASRQRVA